MITGHARRVLIAGGGVAGLEALLALRRLLGERVRVEVLAPEAEFAYRQFAVGEPFSRTEVVGFDLAELIAEAGGVHRRDLLAGVDPRSKRAFTGAGAEVPYDSLLIAIGGSPRPAIPGALTYDGAGANVDVRDAMLALDRGQSGGLAFAVPATVHWPLPAYELALLAGAHLAEIGDSGLPLHLVTDERRPLELFGPAVGERVAGLLDQAGVSFHGGVAPARALEGGLALADGSTIACGAVVALPELVVAPIAGVPQGPHGFISTDAGMRVEGVPDVFAVGDAGWWPVKQGGLAAHQADVAATAIAAEVDPEIEPQRFRPQLRAAMLTGSTPLYLRAGHAAEPAVTSEAPLWWPPAKVAGKYLSPFIAAHAVSTNQPQPELVDLEPATPADAEEHRAAARYALSAADAAAEIGDHRSALRWLAVAERLELTLSPDYALRREQWRREAGSLAE